MNRRRLLTLALYTLVFWLAGIAPWPSAAAPIELDDPATLLPPSRATSEMERDRLEAAAMFAAGRVHDQEPRPLRNRPLGAARGKRDGPVARPRERGSREVGHDATGDVTEAEQVHRHEERAHVHEETGGPDEGEAGKLGYDLLHSGGLGSLWIKRSRTLACRLVVHHARVAGKRPASHREV